MKKQIKRLSLKDLEFGYICSECADVRGGKWPENHCATSHTNQCPYCGKEKGLCAVTDYLWKGDTRLRYWD